MAQKVKAGTSPQPDFIPAETTPDFIPATDTPQSPPAQKEGFTGALGSDLWGMVKSAADPKNALLNAATLGFGSTLRTIANAPHIAERYQQEKAQGYSLPYRVVSPVAENMVGVNVPGMENAAQKGDIGGVAGHAAAVPVAIATTAALAKGAPVIRPVVAKTLSAVSDVVPPEVTGVFSPRLGNMQRVAGKLGKVLTPAPAPVAAPQLEAPMSPAAEQLQSRIQVERGLREQEPFPRQSEGLPEVEEGQAAATQHLQNAVQPRETSNFRMEQTPRRFTGEVAPEIPGRVSTYDFVGQRSSPIPSRPGLMLNGEVEPPQIAAPPKQLPAAFNPLPRTPKMPPVPGTAEMPFKESAPQTPTAIATKPITRQYFGGLLDQAYGAKSLSKDIPLRQQLDRVTPTAPKESSVVKSHSYDPQTREMTVTTHNGQTYIHGDVTPEQAQAFSQSDSKGKAWNNLRGSSTLVAKVVNGKRVPIKPAGPRIATPSDLTPILEKSVQIAKAKK